jgi:hypothetical protein
MYVGAIPPMELTAALEKVHTGSSISVSSNDSGGETWESDEEQEELTPEGEHRNQPRKAFGLSTKLLFLPATRESTKSEVCETTKSALQHESCLAAS